MFTDNENDALANVGPAAKGQLTAPAAARSTIAENIVSNSDKM